MNFHVVIIDYYHSYLIRNDHMYMSHVSFRFIIETNVSTTAEEALE